MVAIQGVETNGEQNGVPAIERSDEIDGQMGPPGIILYGFVSRALIYCLSVRFRLPIRPKIGSGGGGSSAFEEG
jgi:hypothetical protein